MTVEQALREIVAADDAYFNIMCRHALQMAAGDCASDKRHHEAQELWEKCQEARQLLADLEGKS